MHDVKIHDTGLIDYRHGHMLHRANFPLLVIRRAWAAGCDFEKEADGFGAGLGTMGGDWSGIRDSGESAIAAMFAKAMDFGFPVPVI